MSKFPEANHDTEPAPAMGEEIDLGQELGITHTPNENRAIGYFKMEVLTLLAVGEACTIQEFVVKPEYRVLVGILKVNLGEKKALTVIQEFLNDNLELFEIE